MKESSGDNNRLDPQMSDNAIEIGLDSLGAGLEARIGTL